MRDPYDVLQVPRNASRDDIKKAYRRLAKKLHPDINPGKAKVEQQFKETTAAYDLLSDPVQRRRYDRGEIDAGGAERMHGFRRRAQGAEAGRQGFNFEDLPQGIFADLFGEGRRGARMRGTDVSYTVTVDFIDVALGAKKRLTLADDKTLEVTIPPGAEDGQSLRLKGQGMPGFGGAPAGDAFVELKVAPHPLFTRRGRDIHVELPVSLPEAVLGASVAVPTLEGKVALKVPQGSNTGSVLRLKGKGIVDRATGARGDQYVKLKVVLPDRVDPELAEFVERWAKGRDYNPRRKTGIE